MPAMTRSAPRGLAGMMALAALSAAWLSPTGAFAVDPIPKCGRLLAELAAGKPLSTELMASLGLRELPEVKRAIVVPMKEGEWAAASAQFEREALGMRKSIEKLGIDHGHGKEFVAVERTADGGVHARGHRYIVSGSGVTRRVFFVSFDESLARLEGGNVLHSASVNLYEIGPGGALRKVGYADHPHFAGGEPRWFHAHDASGAVVGTIPAAGFNQPALPEIVRWAKAFVETRAP